MKFYVFIFSVFYAGLCFADWSLKRDYGDATIYLSENSTRLTISHKTTVPKKKQFTKELLNKLKNQKKDLLEKIGVTDWNLEDQELTKEDSVTKIYLKGSYIDSRGKKEYFVERHYYSDSSKLQVLLTNENQDLLGQDSHEKNIQGFKVKYGF